MQWNLTGELLPCQGCMISKSKQKNVNKVTACKAEKAGERLFVDISGPFKPTLKGNKYWMRIVDDYSRFKTSKFIKYKNQLKEELCNHIKILNKNDKKVKHVRLYNDG